MKTITSDQIEKAWRKIETMSDDELGEAFLLFEENQPQMLDYLENSAGDILNTQERDELIFNGFSVYQIISYIREIPLIKKEQLEKTEERDFGHFTEDENIVNAQEDLDRFIDNNNQIFLMEEFMDIILEDSESGIFRRNSVSAVFFILAALIGAVDETVH